MKNTADAGSQALPGTTTAEVVPCLVRIPEVFSEITDEVLRTFGAISCKKLGNEYHLIKTTAPDAVRDSDAAMFARWNLPVHHSWPCNPQKMDGFVEKAAQALLEKFGGRKPQAILIGQLDPGSPHHYYRSLASNLRGRVLQLFPPMEAASAEEQKPGSGTLFCLVGKEGLYCGMQSPRESNGLHPGGSRFISHDAEGTISRAGAKIAEALHYLLLHRPPLHEGVHWLELGASPGGMTSELLARGHRVTAVDRAAMDKRLDHHDGLTFVRADVSEFLPEAGMAYDAILCDMNGDAHESMRQVMRLARHLTPGGLVVFTLKIPYAGMMAEPVKLFRSVVAMAATAGLHLVARTHLTYNREELTLFLEKRRGPDESPSGSR